MPATAGAYQRMGACQPPTHTHGFYRATLDIMTGARNVEADYV